MMGMHRLIHLALITLLLTATSTVLHRNQRKKVMPTAER